MKKRVWGLLLALITSLPLPAAARQFRKGTARLYIVYVGTYTGPNSKGIYAYRFNPATGRAAALGLAADAVNPSFLAISPDQKLLFAVNEVADYHGAKSGAVSSFRIDHKSGKLTLLNQVSSRGAGPCFVSVDKNGKFVLVANYDGGSIADFPVLEDGRLGPASAFVQHTGHGANPRRQQSPHAHCIRVDRQERYALAADLGLDQLLIYHFDSRTGSLTPNRPPFAEVKAGSGPRHFTFDPGGRFLYLVNEMASTIDAFSYDGDKGTLRPMQTISTLPASFHGTSYAAEIAVHPSGRFVYASNRGQDSIAVFAVDPATHTLHSVGYVSTRGKFPRNFAITPDGAYMFVANQNSNNVVIFRVNRKTGMLTAAGQSLSVGSPVCVKFVAAE
ncbi:MAG TPA: lactonase family protein [Terriglobales bacterium]|nr:lactonase family protein [Terriglobales bacterium]